jgi:hypothetical protein
MWWPWEVGGRRSIRADGWCDVVRIDWATFSIFKMSEQQEHINIKSAVNEFLSGFLKTIEI